MKIHGKVMGAEFISACADFPYGADRVEVLAEDGSTLFVVCPKSEPVPGISSPDQSGFARFINENSAQLVTTERSVYWLTTEGDPTPSTLGLVFSAGFSVAPAYCKDWSPAKELGMTEEELLADTIKGAREQVVRDPSSLFYN